MSRAAIPPPQFKPCPCHGILTLTAPSTDIFSWAVVSFAPCHNFSNRMYQFARLQGEDKRWALLSLAAAAEAGYF